MKEYAFVWKTRGFAVLVAAGGGVPVPIRS